ncbi:MAG: hypothetical protein Q7T01_02480 [bacterium]|nr:hypothetical protein [bacterium]
MAPPKIPKQVAAQYDAAQAGIERAKAALDVVLSDFAFLASAVDCHHHAATHPTAAEAARELDEIADDLCWPEAQSENGLERGGKVTQITAHLRALAEQLRNAPASAKRPSDDGAPVDYELLDRQIALIADAVRGALKTGFLREALCASEGIRISDFELRLLGVSPDTLVTLLGRVRHMVHVHEDEQRRYRRACTIAHDALVEMEAIRRRLSIREPPGLDVTSGLHDQCNRALQALGSVMADRPTNRDTDPAADLESEMNVLRDLALNIAQRAPVATAATLNMSVTRLGIILARVRGQL